MARWDVRQAGGKTEVSFVNPMSGERYDCGDQGPDVPLVAILDWIAVESEPGDVAFLDGREVLFKLNNAAA